MLRPAWRWEPQPPGGCCACRGAPWVKLYKVVSASECPFDPEEGPMFIREGIRSIESLQLAEDDKRKIYFGNAIGLLGLEKS